MSEVSQKWSPTPPLDPNPGPWKRFRWGMRRALVPPALTYLRHFRQSDLNLTLLQRVLEPDLRWRDQALTASTRFGAQMHLDTRDIIQRYLYIFGTWEPHISNWISRRLKPGDLFIDIGANVGYYSLLAAHLVGAEGRVIAIEPSPSIRAKLQNNIDLNSYRNIDVLGYAISSERGKIPFYMGPPESIGMSSMLQRDELTYEGEVECCPLGDLVDAETWQRAHIVKIDVEGAELEVVKSLLPLLPRAHPDLEIYVEISPQWMEDGGDGAESLMSLLGKQGFNAYSLPNDYGCAAYAKDSPAVAPARFNGELEGQLDIVFSRIDADHL